VQGSQLECSLVAEKKHVRHSAHQELPSAGYEWRRRNGENEYVLEPSQ
jgi:hypothetical protein